MAYITVTDNLDYPLAAHINQFSTGVGNLETGWTVGVGTWTYASATSISIPSGGASIYAVGDRIKLTQTTVKYFYVVSVADTALGITGGTDYTLANAAITLPYFSHAASPVGFPSRFVYAPTLTFTAGTPPNTITTSTYYFSLTGKTCTVSAHVVYTNAGATVTAVTITLPIAHASGLQAAYGYLGAGAQNATFADISTTLRLFCTSVSANRLIAGSSYFI